MVITTSVRAEEECSLIRKIFSNKCEQEKMKKEIEHSSKFEYANQEIINKSFCK
jgi:hypothetical protein